MGRFPGIAAPSYLTNGSSGGIRGIVELEILRQIEQALSGIPIRCFFDLIVGTRYISNALYLTEISWLTLL